MPMMFDNQYGTEADGSLNSDYCIHCYEQGKFEKPDITLEEMIEHYAPHWGKWSNRPNITIEEAKEEIRAKLSPLKRWSR